MEIAKLESFIFEKMSLTRLPGLSIALIKGNDVVYSRGFGLADIARGRPATERTLYGAASLTKSFIAIAILQLAEKGLLRLDDPLERFGPCPIKSADGVVCIEHLLSHTSGLPAIGYIEAVLRHAHKIGGCNLPIAGARDVLTFAGDSSDWTESPAGKRWFYLNEGYVLLGEIVRRISGKPYEQYIRDHILNPLGMSRSFFAEEDVTRDGDWALPYVLPRDGGEPRAGRYLYNVLSADASLITSALDLAKYLTMFLGKGKGLLSPESFETMIRPRVSLPGKPADASVKPAQYALGLSIAENFFGEKLIGHSGSLIIATSHFAFLPKSNVGVAVLCNGNGYGMATIAKAALAVMLGHDPQELSLVRTENAMEELTGYYETFRGTLRVKLLREGDFLRMEYLCGDQSPGAVTFVPERVIGDEPRFFTYSEGQRFAIDFRRPANKPIEFLYERYKFRRTGPLT